MNWKSCMNTCASNSLEKMGGFWDAVFPGSFSGLLSRKHQHYEEIPNYLTLDSFSWYIPFTISHKSKLHLFP